MKLFSDGPQNLYALAVLVVSDISNVKVQLVQLDKAAANEKDVRDKNIFGEFPFLEL